MISLQVGGDLALSKDATTLILVNESLPEY